MRIAKSPAAIVAALVMFASTFLVAFTAAPANAATAPFKVISANIGSGADNDLNGNKIFDGWGTNENPLIELTAQINRVNPDAVLVQEACTRDYAKAKQKWPNYYFGDFVWQQEGSAPGRPAIDENSCEKSNGGTAVEQKGTFIMSRHPIVSQSLQVLPVVPVADTADAARGTRKARRHTLAGALIVWGGAPTQSLTYVFNTHLPAGDEADDIESRKQSVYAIRDALNPIEANYKTILGGDFNDEPKTFHIDQLHRVNRAGTGTGTGMFWEAAMEYNRDGTKCQSSFGVCRDGHTTLRKSGRKSDYIFFGKTYVQAKFSVDSSSHRSETSAHNVLVGQVDLIDAK